MLKREFGDEITTCGFGVHGVISATDALELAKDIVDAIGMTCSHPPTVTLYEPKDGKPSLGYIVQQCIVESFITLDVWPERHGLYIHIASCKDFEVGPVYEVLKAYGLKARSVFGGYLSL
jgi:hypothetical protein